MVLCARVNVDGCVCVREEAVCYCFPHSDVGVMLRNHIVQPVVKLLVWGGSP